MTIATFTTQHYDDLEKRYLKVLKLLEEESKNDPENQPYMSKYLARQVLIGMKASIEHLLRNHAAKTPEHIKLSAMLAAVYLYLGIICADTEESDDLAEKHFDRAVELVEPYKVYQEHFSVTLTTYNQLGILWADKDQEKSKQFLEESEAFYKNHKNDADAPMSISCLFTVDKSLVNPDEEWKAFEKIHTFTLYYLAQIYGKLDKPLKSAVYCHTTLKRQLAYGDYEPIDWALNVATLAQYFLEKNGFKQARHHLSLASYVLGEYEKKLDAIEEKTETAEAEKERFRHRSADVARCWAKYGVNLLGKSKERLINHDDLKSLSTDLTAMSLKDHPDITADDLQNLVFESVDVSVYENQVADTFILTREDAKLVFLNALSWLSEAQKYYSLENLASDNIQIVLDQSQLYVSLLFFDDNPDNQAKLYKRRADLLEATLSKVNPKYYLQYCRIMWNDLAVTYLEMLDIKLDKHRESKIRPSPHALIKINTLVEKSITHYTKFIESFKDGESFNVTEENERVFVKAYFHIGVLYSKYITLDKIQRVQNVEHTLDAYKKFLAFCEKRPKLQERVLSELDICKEMSTLLPLQLKRLQDEAMTTST